jgi:hypothetical protein
MFRFYSVILPVFFIFLSCVGSEPVNFQVTGTSALLFGNSRAAQEGSLDFSAPKKLEYSFGDSFKIAPNSMLFIEYSFDKTPPSALRETTSLVLDMGNVSWELPIDTDKIRYSIPVQSSFDGHFNIVLEITGKLEKEDAPVLRITSLGFSGLWCGFITMPDGTINSTPFINKKGNGSYEIDIPSAFNTNESFTQIEAVFSGDAALEFAGNRIETFSGNNKIFVRSIMYRAEGQATLSAQDIESFILTFTQIPVFPEPIKADPCLVIEWPQKNWRNRNYEIFRWDSFPSLLIFDFADYAVQDRM